MRGDASLAGSWRSEVTVITSRTAALWTGEAIRPAQSYRCMRRSCWFKPHQIHVAEACSSGEQPSWAPVWFQGELHPCGERCLDLLRPPWLQGPAVHPGARRVPRIPEVELPQWSHGILQAHPHGRLRLVWRIKWPKLNVLHFLKDFFSRSAYKVSSLVLFFPSSQHGEHYRIELFEACNYSGQCMEICDDCPFLQSRGFSSCVNSVRVFGDGA